MQKWLNAKKIAIFVMSAGLLFSLPLYAAVSSPDNIFYSDRTELIAKQTELLKNRLSQAQSQLTILQRQEAADFPDFTSTTLSKKTRTQASLDIAVAKSNVDSVDIELAESEQTMSRLEKDMQEIENQLNVSSIFGVKISRSDPQNLTALKAELMYQKNILGLEKLRTNYLLELQKIASASLQLQKTKYIHINARLKSQTILHMKELQAQSEVNFQQQQSYWLLQLNNYYAQLNKIETGKVNDKQVYAALQTNIFYANENLNYSYLQMLIVRYQDQLQQLKIAISHSTSITLLNKASDQMQMLTKQLSRVNDLLTIRMKILDRRKVFLLHDKDNAAGIQADIAKLTKLEQQYQAVMVDVVNVYKKIMLFRSTLDQALQFELSSRQGLPGLNAKAWLDLGAEVWMVPSLTYHVVKSLATTVSSTLHDIRAGSIVLIGLLEAGLIALFFFANKILARLVSGMAEQELGHVNLKRLAIQLLRRNFFGIFIIGNVIALFNFCNIPSQSSNFLINLAMVWLFFKVIINMVRICLVETVHDRAGHDVRLYHRLKWSFLIGGVITASAVFIHQLPVVYEVKDLFNRLFLLFLFVVSVFLLKSWEIMPALILPHIDDRRLYLKKIVRLIGFILPLILLINCAMGLFGYVNLVLTISWYESIFILTLISYLLIRGLLIDGMMILSSLMVQYVVNGWLWTEAFLKPIDKVLRMALFFTSGAVLFSLYGWNQQSPVVMELNKLLHYHLVDMLNTSITLLSLIELGIIISVLFWTARWTREFVYRLLSKHTNDIGVRNSIAILCQYTIILIGIFVCLRILGIDLKTLMVIGSGLAIAIGFGLRDLANNFACGFLMLIERPVRVGDTVKINDHEGEVTHIGGRAITIRTWDHMEVIVPNAEIFGKSFVNWTAKDPVVRTVISIKINRHDSPEDIQALIYKVLSTQKDVLKDPIPEVFLKEMSDSLMELEVRYFVNLRFIKSRIGMRSEVLVAIWQAFQANGIQPPYPHQEIHLRGSLPALTEDVEAKGERLIPSHGFPGG